jgi:concanavalin A-like lectin/glucanase superfamily protein
MRSRSYILVVALVAGLAVPALAAGTAWAKTSASGSAATVPDPVMVAQYDFDDRSRAVFDESGNGHTMRLVASRGGTVRPVARGTGRGLAFPVKCVVKLCPHAVLQSPDSADLNPGTRPLTFGAMVRLAGGQTSKGQNVVQKGYSATGSQYKLQIDGLAGRPSCVLVDDKKPILELVRGSVTVADGAWHSVACRRTGAFLVIMIDGVLRGMVMIPATLSVTNAYPLSIGGKGTSRDNDQFQGALDNVWVRIG